MSKNEMITKIEAIRELEQLIEEAKAEADALRDEIKQMMLANDTTEMEVGQYMVRYANILTQRFDSTAFKKAHSALYKEFIRQSASRRFTITA